MGLFETALRELGTRVEDEHGGSFLALAHSGDGSAEALAAHLASWPTWHDVSTYDGRPVPFWKRAQIAAADLALAGLAPAADLPRLTLFADNLVPHVLRIDGVLAFDDDLVARIEAERADRARLARGGRDPRLRPARRRAARRRPRRHHRHGGRLRALDPRGRAAVQGAPAASGAHDGVLRLGGGARTALGWVGSGGWSDRRPLRPDNPARPTPPYPAAVQTDGPAGHSYRGACTNGSVICCTFSGSTRKTTPLRIGNARPVYLTAIRSMISSAASPSTVSTTRPRTCAIR